MVVHPIEPLYDTNSKILILGSFPSVKSREHMFFYSHPKNRFWKVLSAVFDCEMPCSIEEKREFLHKNRIVLWDVIESCDISGSADSSIKNVKANNISRILDNAPIERIFVNGKTALKYYDKYIKEQINRSAICLPSTSPANAVKSEADLINEWEVIR